MQGYRPRYAEREPLVLIPPPGRRRRSAGRIVRVLLATSLATVLVVPMLSAGAADSSAAADPEIVTLDLQKEAYFSYPIDDAIPPSLINDFPPLKQILCLEVSTQLCSEQAEEVWATVEGIVPDEDIPNFPIQPVAPNTIPVGLLGGHTRFTAAMQFAVPPIAADANLDRVDLVLAEDGLTFALDSPAFRQAVLAILDQVRHTGEQEQFEKLLMTDVVRNTVQDIVGIEMCAATTAFQDGENQLPADEPERDCLYGANGVRDGASGTWTFDMTFAVEAWRSGALANEGVFFRPLAAPNLAYGDQDPSTNVQVSFSGAAGAAPPQAVIVLAPPPPPPPPPPPGPTAPPTYTPPPGPVYTPPPPNNNSNFPYVPVQPLPPANFPPSVPGGEPPVVAPPVDQPPVAAPGDPVLPATQAPASTPWYLWLLVPIGLTGMYVLAQTLTAAPVSAVDRAGAMTRLIERQRVGGMRPGVPVVHV